MAAAAGNPLVRDLTAAIRESLRRPILERFESLESWEDVAVTLRSDHEAIFAAVGLGNGEGAAMLVEEHMRTARHTLHAAAR